MSLAFDHVYREYGDALYAFIKSMLVESADADDCFQQCCLAIHKALPKYRESGKLRPWLFTIARNCAFDFMRQQRQDWASYEDEAVDELSEQDPLALLDAQEVQFQVQAAIAALSPKLRSVFLLRTQQNLSFKEIADILDEPINRLLGRMHLANKKLMSALQRLQDDYV